MRRRFSTILLARARARAHAHARPTRPQELEGIWGWKEFFETHEVYTRVGLVVGRWYGAAGEPLEAFPRERLERLAAWQEERKKALPDCNSRWSQADGSEVWCSPNSGGIQREWAGLPRLYSEALDPRATLPEGGSGARELCVCAPSELANARRYLKPYHGCDAAAERCRVLPAPAAG